MSIRKLKATVREHDRQLERHQINSVYGTTRSVTTKGTIVRPDVTDSSSSTSSTSTRVPRWA